MGSASLRTRVRCVFRDERKSEFDVAFQRDKMVLWLVRMTMKTRITQSCDYFPRKFANKFGCIIITVFFFFFFASFWRVLHTTRIFILVAVWYIIRFVCWFFSDERRVRFGWKWSPAPAQKPMQTIWIFSDDVATQHFAQLTPLTESRK